MGRRRQRIPKETIELQTESLSHEGRAIARLDGKALFITNALAGERIEARYTRVHRRFDELDTVRVIEAVRGRVEPRCPHAAVCGGCSLQHLDPALQIAHKQAVLSEQLQHFGGQAPRDWAPPLVSAQYGYRSRARLSARFVYKRDEVLVGFREKHSAFVADLSVCHVLVEEVGQRLLALRTMIRTLEALQAIPQVEVVAGENCCALIFRHMSPLGEADLQRLQDFGQTHQLDILLQPGRPDTVHPLYLVPTPHSQCVAQAGPVVPDVPVLPSAPEGCEDLSTRYEFTPEEGTVIAFGPADFTQVNLALNRKMVAQALAWLQPGEQDTILDLFCGLGNFSLPLALRCKQVIGVEGDAAMVAKAERNAARNGRGNLSFHAADLHDEKLFSGPARAQWQQPVDLLLLDPPRSGAELLCRHAKELNPARILYVSCNPATLARDAGILAGQGYVLQRAGVLDMFPHTAHVESMALFVRA